MFVRVTQWLSQQRRPKHDAGFHARDSSALREQGDAAEEKGHINNKAAGRPPAWGSSKESSFQERQIKIQWLANQDNTAVEGLKTRMTFDDVEDTVDLNEQW